MDMYMLFCGTMFILWILIPHISILCRKGHLDVVSYLITSCGASVLAKGYDGETPLHTAWYTHYV